MKVVAGAVVVVGAVVAVVGAALVEVVVVVGAALVVVGTALVVLGAALVVVVVVVPALVVADPSTVVVVDGPEVVVVAGAGDVVALAPVVSVAVVVATAGLVVSADVCFAFTARAPTADEAVEVGLVAPAVQVDSASTTSNDAVTRPSRVTDPSTVRRERAAPVVLLVLRTVAVTPFLDTGCVDPGAGMFTA
ncbi:hypothetical protein ACWEQ4_07355 [Rhodococcus sp. NPDC003994]